MFQCWPAANDERTARCGKEACKFPIKILWSIQYLLYLAWAPGRGSVARQRRRWSAVRHTCRPAWVAAPCPLECLCHHTALDPQCGAGKGVSAPFAQLTHPEFAAQAAFAWTATTPVVSDVFCRQHAQQRVTCKKQCQHAGCKGVQAVPALHLRQSQAAAACTTAGRGGCRPPPGAAPSLRRRLPAGSNPGAAPAWPAIQNNHDFVALKGRVGDEANVPGALLFGKSSAENKRKGSTCTQSCTLDMQHGQGAPAAAAAVAAAAAAA